jgi:hypothetical protein
MLDAHIIDKMKREREEREPACEPLPLEMPAAEEDDREKRKKDGEEESRVVQIRF